MASSEQHERVAVIAVHGVADQRPGDTARAIADLLIAAPPDGARYTQRSSEGIGVHVETLPPSVQARDATDDAGAAANATPTGPRPLRKAIAQSMGSDIQRRHWAVDETKPETPPSTPRADAGIEFTDFLLFKAQRNGTPSASYDTTRLDLAREQGGRTQRVDVYEMYWADLSRLSSGVPRIITELFTLLFRLSQLGRDAVALAARQVDAGAPFARRWQWLSRLQSALDWAFSKGLGLLTAQLLMAALIIVPVGLVLPLPAFAEHARTGLEVVLPGLLFFVLLYRFDKKWSSALRAVLAIALLCVLLARAPAHWVVGAVWLALLSLAYDRVMRLCDERFPMTRFVGWCMWSVVLAIVVVSAALAPSGQAASLRAFSFGALRAVEFVLAATVLWWGAAGLLLFAWMVTGQACVRSVGFDSGATVATGRLGLFASMTFFIVLTMATWAALTTLLDLSVAGLDYVPLIFRDGPAGQPVAAAAFLDARYENSTETFSLVVLLLMALGGYLVIGLFPSVLAEMMLLRSGAARLGRWLTAVYRWLNLSVALLVVVGSLAAVLVGISLNSRWFGAPWLMWVNALFPQVPRWSQEFLKPLIWTAASATVALTVLGGVLSRYVPWLRAPLDIALDVDSHFREFPRRAIPRARIFSRFAALLQQVSQQGYERIVIVAHSQGTVISAELLRYLRHRCLTDPGDDALAQWARQLDGRLHLLTAGSPLRQLYAARFPALYRWVLHDEASMQRMGPTAQGIGVQRWVNAYATGDYVGRWLWSRPARARGDVSDAMIDEVQHPRDVYEAADAAPDLASAMGSAAELDVCLGAGAHTHYFDADQRIVGQLIDQLIVTPRPQQQLESAPQQRAA